MSFIVEGISNIWNRIFDHKLFLSGEIQFTLREYETKRSDEEVNKLLNLLEKVSDLRDIQLQRAANCLSNNTSIQINETFNIIGMIQGLETESVQNETLELYRRDRGARWEKLVDNIQTSCETIDQTFAQKEDELENFFAKFNK